MIGLRTLVLTNSYSPKSVFPLSTIPAEIAIHRYVRKTCDVVYWYDRKIKTQNYEFYWPSVIVNFHNKDFGKHVKLNDESLFYRDHGRCQYCGVDLELSSRSKKRLTKDHVIAESKGGKTAWNNVVACCADCNIKKGDSDPKGQWKPKNDPYEPNFFELVALRKKHPIVIDDPRWVDFLPGWVGEIIIKRPAKGIIYENIN